MSKFTQYLDQYPNILPGDVQRPDISQFDYPENRGQFFQQFLALQANPTGAILNKMNLPERLRQFMSLGG
ncbi:hypothetical protein EBT25_14120 [bacterium]|nr:hypothetical protein [bacterium]